MAGDTAVLLCAVEAWAAGSAPALQRLQLASALASVGGVNLQSVLLQPSGGPSRYGLRSITPDSKSSNV